MPNKLHGTNRGGDEHEEGDADGHVEEDGDVDGKMAIGDAMGW